MGEGEMSQLIRTKDWSSTSIDNIDRWPQSLKTTLGIMLHSAFPMFLFWGDELLCFYNDAYRPSLGIEGKHPALGKKAEDVWVEIWDFIGPLIQQVRETGKPAWFENQLLPIYRNGKMEDVYWTFSYSAAFGDDGAINGVLVTCVETTQQVTSRKMLKDSEQEIYSYIENAPFPIGVYIGEEMRIAFANKAITDVWGKGDNVTGKLYDEILPELADQHVFEQLRDVYQTGIPFEAKNQRIDLMVNQKTESFYFNYAFTPLFDNSGKVYGVMNTAADVTELNIAQQKTLQSESNFRNMILQAPVAMCIFTGPQHVVAIANSSMIDLWGKAAGAVLGKPVFDALPDAREQGLEALIDGVYNTGETVKANERPVTLVRHGKAENLYLNFAYEPYRNVKGEIIGVFAIALDVTQQVTARREIEREVDIRTTELSQLNTQLKQSEERYYRMINEVEDYAIILMDKNGIIQSWNLGAQKIKGYTEEEVTGKHFKMFYRPEEQQKGLPQQLMAEAAANGKTTSDGWRLKKDGSLFWASILLTALHDTQGNVIGFSKVTRDVTDKKMAEDKLKEYSANLEFQNRELEQFAYAASHDMKEPLRKIHLFGSLLEDNIATHLNEKSAGYLKRILKSATKMGNLVDNILSYSKTSLSTETLNPVDLGAIAEEIISGLEQETDIQAVTFESDHLPVINGVPFQCSQLIENLVHNAIKYQHPDRECVIRIEHKLVKSDEVNLGNTATASHYHHISITDNGIGFDPVYSEKIFEIFQRLDTVSGKDGAGIGLAICRRIMLNHKGFITATGKLDEGAQFNLYFPAMDGNPA
jgi:PAS domain S-box-containing protein